MDLASTWLLLIIAVAACEDGGDALGTSADAGAPGDGGTMTDTGPADAADQRDGAAGSTAAEICAALCSRIEDCFEPDPSCFAGCAADLGDCSAGELPALAACAAASCIGLRECIEAVDCAVEDCGDGVCTPAECDSCAADCPGSSAQCLHDECTAGAPLAAECSVCAGLVCSFDSHCCFDFWDARCIAVARSFCAECPSVCGDTLCDELETAENCPEDCPAFCGDGDCTSQAEDCGSCPEDCGDCTCGDGTCNVGECASCEADCPGGCVCPHDVCDVGAPLDPGCGECEALVCSAIDSDYCCIVAWDRACFEEAVSACGRACPRVCEQAGGEAADRVTAARHRPIPPGAKMLPPGTGTVASSPLVGWP